MDEQFIVVIAILPCCGRLPRENTPGTCWESEQTGNISGAQTQKKSQASSSERFCPKSSPDDCKRTTQQHRYHRVRHTVAIEVTETLLLVAELGTAAHQVRCCQLASVYVCANLCTENQSNLGYHSRAAAAAVRKKTREKHNLFLYRTIAACERPVVHAARTGSLCSRPLHVFCRWGCCKG